ncbi:MAG: cytidine deaminase [Oscillospiraceae bacterium]|nr:cytidine deaminase [Oscillospiraceae bacterium]
MTDRELINIAVEASEKAYAPYSKFAVGAALECDDGTVFTGCNIENAAYGCTNCAERTAVFKAVSEGKREFRRIAIFADTEDYCMPCGTCRQVLNEFAPTIEVLSVRRDGRYVSYSLKELLPKSFSLND